MQKSRLLAVILAVILSLGMLPTAVFAANNQGMTFITGAFRSYDFTAYASGSEANPTAPTAKLASGTSTTLDVQGESHPKEARIDFDFGAGDLGAQDFLFGASRTVDLSFVDIDDNSGQIIVQAKEAGAAIVRLQFINYVGGLYLDEDGNPIGEEPESDGYYDDEYEGDPVRYYYDYVGDVKEFEFTIVNSAPTAPTAKRVDNRSAVLDVQGMLYKKEAYIDFSYGTGNLKADSVELRWTSNTVDASFVDTDEDGYDDKVLVKAVSAGDAVVSLQFINIVGVLYLDEDGDPIGEEPESDGYFDDEYEGDPVRYYFNYYGDPIEFEFIVIESSSSIAIGGSGNGGGGGGSNNDPRAIDHTKQNNSGSTSSGVGITLTTTAATNLAKEAAKAATEAGADAATVKMQNIGAVSLETLKAMSTAAGMPVKFQADSMNANGGVDVRITLDPSLATKDLNLCASTNSEHAQKTKGRFEKFFENDISIISFEQQGSFGQPVDVAAKINPDMNTENLEFYSYDPATNSYTRIETEYFIDKNGYVHFTTELAGDIIISDGPLALKTTEAPAAATTETTNTTDIVA